MAKKMVKQYTKIAPKPVRKKKFVKGYGGMVGRGVGWFRKQATTKGSFPNWALKKVKQLADAVNIEYKIFDSSSASVQPDYNGSIITLNPIPQDATDSGRIGDSCKLQNVIIRGGVTNSTTANIYNRTRVMLIWDEQNQITTLADLLQATGNSSVVLSPKHYDKRFRSVVLYDQLFSTSTYAGSQAFFRDLEINLPINKHTQFAGGTTTINTGALKLVLMSSGVTTNLPNVDYYCRLSYTDD